MNIVERMRNGEKLSIGMVHTLPLPGSFRAEADIETIVKRAVADAVTLERAGFDAVVVENVNDAPYDDNPMTWLRVAALTRVCAEVRRAVSIPMGIDACGDQRAGFDIAAVTGASFIRLSYLVDLRISARGLCEPCSGAAVLHRRAVGAQDVAMFADIQVKHTYPLLPEIPLEMSARWAVAAGADALIVTGAETGAQASTDELARTAKAAGVPVVAGSGVSPQNVKEQYAVCSGAIIGSSLKRGGSLMNPIDEELARAFISAARG